MNLISQIIKRVKGFFIQDIPADIYACETCDETSCLEQDWQNCKYRLRSEEFLELKKKHENNLHVEQE